MKKHFKYLMLLFVTTFGLSLTSCGGDNEDEPGKSGGIEDSNAHSGYLAKGQSLYVTIGSDGRHIIDIYIESPSENFYAINFDPHFSSYPVKVAFIGNFKTISDSYASINDHLTWIPTVSGYEFEDVDFGDCFIFEIQYGVSAYYYILQFVNVKKSLSGDVIGFGYSMCSYDPERGR